MKKVILTLVIGLFFVAFSNAQTAKVAKEEIKKEAKAEYSVDASKASAIHATTGKKAKGCCSGKKAKSSCGDKKAKASSCAGKSKSSCAGKAKSSCGSKKS